jgi:4-amino-4-deoxy-L-arabinose transferase-like glycosyltransferase
VLQLLRKDVRFFAAGVLAALAMRLVFVLHFPGVVDDSRLYADIAMNWLQYGVYGITNSGHLMPTLSRLPGYPAFLAAIFAVFGWSNFRAVLLIQVAFDLGTCFMIADLACRMFSERAAKAAFMLAAICPFLANYSAAALTETLEIFFIAVALDFAICGLRTRTAGVNRIPLLPWVGCGFSTGVCILLRPDGGILLAAVSGYLFLFWLKTILERKHDASTSNGFVIAAAVVLVVCSLSPLLPWTVRNFHRFHRFSPLAPRYANDADEPAMPGFNRWTKTWIADYVSVEDIYWNVPGEGIDFKSLPHRAFDSPRQKEETAQIFADYNLDRDVTPEVDARFAALAAARIQAHPLRYYAGLPALRVADMWLRPRTELLPADPRWWEFNDERRWLTVSLVFGIVNSMYVIAAAIGAIRARAVPSIGLLFLFLLLRSLFLGTLENPEPRYTLECYPVVILLASALFIGKLNRVYRNPA